MSDDEKYVTICGETIDHEYEVIDERDGQTTYLCSRCGAETWEDDE